MFGRKLPENPIGIKGEELKRYEPALEVLKQERAVVKELAEVYPLYQELLKNNTIKFVAEQGNEATERTVSVLGEEWEDWLRDDYLRLDAWSRKYLLEMDPGLDSVPAFKELERMSVHLEQLKELAADDASKKREGVGSRLRENLRKPNGGQAGHEVIVYPTADEHLEASRWDDFLAFLSSNKQIKDGKDVESRPIWWRRGLRKAGKDYKKERLPQEQLRQAVAEHITKIATEQRTDIERKNLLERIQQFRKLIRILKRWQEVLFTDQLQDSSLRGESPYTPSQVSIVRECNRELMDHLRTRVNTFVRPIEANERGPLPIDNTVVEFAEELDAKVRDSLDIREKIRVLKQDLEELAHGLNLEVQELKQTAEGLVWTYQGLSEGEQDLTERKDKLKPLVTGIGQALEKVVSAYGDEKSGVVGVLDRLMKILSEAEKRNGQAFRQVEAMARELEGANLRSLYFQEFDITLQGLRQAISDAREFIRDREQRRLAEKVLPAPMTKVIDADMVDVRPNSREGILDPGEVYTNNEELRVALEDRGGEFGLYAPLVDYAMLPPEFSKEHLRIFKNYLGKLDASRVPQVKNWEQYFEMMYPRYQRPEDTQRNLVAHRPDWWYEQADGSDFYDKETWGEAYKRSIQEESEKLSDRVFLTEKIQKPNYTDGSKQYGSKDHQDAPQDVLLPIIQEVLGPDHNRFGNTWDEVNWVAEKVKEKIIAELRSAGLPVPKFDIVITPAIISNLEMISRNRENSQTNTYEWTSTPLLKKDGGDYGSRLVVGRSGKGGAGYIGNLQHNARSDSLGFRLSATFNNHKP